MRKRPCLLFACIFLTGIVFQRYEWKCLWFVPVIFVGLEIYHGIKGERAFRSHKNLKRMAGRSLVLLSAFFLGINNMKSQEDFRNTYMSKIEDGREAIVFGEILKVEETDYGSRLILTDCYVSLYEANIPCNEVMVYVSSDQYRVGQIYQMKGQFHLFERARNEGNFDSALFYQSQKIDFSIYASESILLGYKENAFRDGILALKIHLENVYKNSLEEEAAGFYMGMMLGDKSLLSERTKDLFAVAGISHILAISGLHMSIIGRGFYNQLRKRKIGFLAAGVLAGVLVLAYCYMVGNGTSAVRAVGMLLIFFFAQYIGRSYDMLNSLGAVVIYLIWDNPFLIEYSGFQFSIAALIGVGFVGQTMSEIAVKRNWSSSIWMSIGITLSTLPIVACCYYEVPLYSPFANSILLPLLTPIFAIALFGALAGCVIPVVGMVALIPCGWLFSFYKFVCELVEGLPFGSVITGVPEMEVVVAYYAVLFVGCLLLKKSFAKMSNDISSEGLAKELSFAAVMISIKKLALTIVCFVLILWPKPSQSEIVFLDVGQGDGIYIGSENGTTCFIDGGSSDVNQVGTYRILPFLKAHGVKRIDYWFVSHADTDHMSGLLEVMEDGYEIGYLVVSDKMPEDENKEQLLSTAEKNEISVIHMKKGDTIQTVSMQQNGVHSESGISITCLYPWENAVDRNEQSLVLLLECLDTSGAGIFKALFSGDISSEAEEQLIEEYGDSSKLKNVDLYKAAHHGSKHSNSQAFLEAIQPKYCVISCGIDNSYGHPSKEAVERLSDVGTKLFYTMESGQITVEIDETIQIYSWLKEFSH